MQFAIALVAAYLLGSITFTQIVARLVNGVDLRTVGSKNVGGRNLTRQVGVFWGLVGGALDVAKGAAALLLARALLPPDASQIWPAIAVVAGHNWPVWLKFRGGKGLATALGVMLVIAPLETLLAFLVALLLLWLTQNILLTALGAFIAGAFLMSRFHYPDYMYWTLTGLFITVLLASLPDIAHKLRTSGGVGEYMRNPNKVYEQEAQTRQDP
jgi:glycerol-3-phosphate acyltransferase PlsY